MMPGLFAAVAHKRRATAMLEGHGLLNRARATSFNRRDIMNIMFTLYIHTGGRADVSKLNVHRS